MVRCETKVGGQGHSIKLRGMRGGDQLMTKSLLNWEGHKICFFIPKNLCAFQCCAFQLLDEHICSRLEGDADLADLKVYREF